MTLILAVYLVAACNTPNPLTPSSNSAGATLVFDATSMTNDWAVDSMRLARTDTLKTTSITTKAMFVYAEKSPKNVADFSVFNLKLNQDGSFNQVDTDGSKSSGTWSLIDGGATLRLENKDTQLIEHYNLVSQDATTLRFTVEIPSGQTYVDLYQRWNSRLGSVYGPMVSKRSLIAIIKMSHH